MFHMVSPEPVDYLVIGHLTIDLTPAGPVLGGSAAYAARVAQAMGKRVGIVTAWGGEIQLSSVLRGIPVVAAEAQHSSTFENIYTGSGRVQYIRHVAPRIDFSLVPAAWRQAGIIHLAPLAQEMDPLLPADFRPGLLALTPQGWFRAWDADGRVHPCEWSQAEQALANAGATVLSVEDVGRDEEQIEWMAQHSRLLAVTDGQSGARLFWNGDSRRFRPPPTDEMDATGAGDVFAASFFIRLMDTHDPWEAVRFAVQMAAVSVTRPGLEGIPTHAEIQQCLIEVLK
jgi:sugar/nucleoside kinase (ribokinase family)